MVRIFVTWDVLLVLLNPPQDFMSCRVGARPGHPISGLMHRSIQPTGSGLYSSSSSALASWGRQFETVPTPNVPGGGYPDHLGRDETRCRPESGSARFKPFCFQFLADTGNRAW